MGDYKIPYKVKFQSLIRKTLIIVTIKSCFSHLQISQKLQLHTYKYIPFGHPLGVVYLVLFFIVIADPIASEVITSRIAVNYYSCTCSVQF